MKIDHFFIKRLKKNLDIFITFVINLVLVIFLIVFFNHNINFFNQQKEIATNEIKRLKEKNDLIILSDQLKNKNLDLDRLNKLLLLLMPNEEDYFSIILSLEKIAKKTNFLITGYSLNLKNSSPNRLSIAISGKGDRNAFLNFIKDYKFVGGRLITIDKIQYSESNLNPDQKINLNFYSGRKERKDYFIRLNSGDIELINKIQSSINLEEESIASEEGQKNLEYETKTNPF